MKRIIHKLSAIIVLAIFLCGSVPSQQAEGMNGRELAMIGQAMGAFRTNCHVEGPLKAGVTTIGTCEDGNGGSMTRVTLFPKLNCRLVDCDLVRPAPLGYVDFDCDGNITQVVCENAVNSGGTGSAHPSGIQ
jgi:hypothetical protein